MFVRRNKYTAIEDLCKCSLSLRQTDPFQYRQRYNTGNVPLLTHHTYTDHNNANLSICGSNLLFGDHFVFVRPSWKMLYMSNFIKHCAMIV